ncbi:MAG: D-alanyl-D-alanine carboxypeptidase [Clostridia bacterium]|nr:D-alanyl-D-alanine carboxypeptidase [Clostridia bacterium]
MKRVLFTIYSVLILFVYTISCSVIQNTQVFAKTDTNIETEAKSILLMDYNSNTIILEKNSKARLPIASMVKLMTILLTYEAIENNQFSLQTKVSTTENAAKMGGSQVFIDPFVEYSVNDLLKSVIMASANDASVALAEYICGSEVEFVNLMNKRAKELGMENTLYANCTGLPAPEQYSCAYDCAIVLKEVMKHEHYHTISNVWMDTLTHPSGRKTELVNTNKLVKYYKGCDSGKTGSTSEAGYCLTTSAIRDGFRLIAVVIGSKTGQDRFKDASTLLNFGFANYENKIILDSNTPIIENYRILQAKCGYANIYVNESFYGLCKKGNKTGYDITYEIDQIKAPLKSGDKVGTLFIAQNGIVIKSVYLIVNQDIEKNGFYDNLKQITQNW